LIKRPSFDKQYINAELDKLSTTVARSTTIFIIGGLALINYGLKVATKDIDVVLTKPADLEVLLNALESAGYDEPNDLLVSRPYHDMEISKIMENEDGFRWDIFVKKICNKLVFSDSMASRSTEFYSKAHVTLRIASKEDIFLFKGITNRAADLDDLRLLAESGLDWEMIRTECRHQSEASGRLWEDALVQNLIDLRERYGIISPIEKELRKIAEEKLIEDFIVKSVAAGLTTIKAISQAKNLPYYFVRECAIKMEEKSLLIFDKKTRPYRLSLVKSDSR